jgi:hypothetical protein
MSKLSKSEIADLDKWIEQLKECQPLEECQVKTLCEKVINKFYNIIFYINIIIGKRNPKTRTKCPTCQGPCNCMWRYPWSVF